MKKVLIAGHYNLNNGDRAVLEATIQQLLLEYPDLDITVSAVAPKLLKDDRYNVVPWPIQNSGLIFKFAKFLACHNIGLPRALINPSYAEALGNADLILFSGGHHLTDLLGEETFYSLAFNYLVPINAGKKLVLLPQTVGPFNNVTPTMKAILDVILLRSEKIYVRDDASINSIVSLCPGANVELAPDVVYGLRLSDKCAESQQPKAGIALYCNYATDEGRKKLEAVVDSLVGVCGFLAERGLRVGIIPMEVCGSDADDRPIARELIRRFDLEYPEMAGMVEIEEPEPGGILRTVEQFAGKKIVFACKTHSVIFSMIANAPLIGIAYHVKTKDFMSRAQLGNYAIFDEDCTRDALIQMAVNVLAHCDEIRESEQSFTRANTESLARIFKSLELD